MKKEKNLKNKEKNKSVLNTVLTFTALVFSTLALLFSCSASATATKAQALKDVVVTEKRQANILEQDYYLNGDGFSYHVDYGLSNDVYNAGFNYLMENYDFDNSPFYLFYEDLDVGYTLLEIYDITYIDVDSFTYLGKQFTARNPSSTMPAVWTFRYTNDLMLLGFYLIFEYDFLIDSNLTVMLDKNGTYIINNYHPVNNYVDISSITLDLYDFYLEGNFTIPSSFEDELYSIPGTLHYYNSSGNFVTYEYSYFTLTFVSGLQFYGVDRTVFTPYFRTEMNGRYSYTLLNMKLDITYVDAVKITPFLTKSTYDTISEISILVDSLSIYEKTYNLMDLYYYGNPRYLPADERHNTYNFNFSSAGARYSVFNVDYSFVAVPLTHFTYWVTYDETLVLQVRGDIDLNNSGDYAGINYSFITKIEDRQQFTILDYFNVDIQRFQVYELQYSKLSNNIHIDNGYEGLGMSFNLIISALTSFLPFLSYEIFPGITFSILICVPLLITLLLFIFKMFKR